MSFVTKVLCWLLVILNNIRTAANKIVGCPLVITLYPLKPWISSALQFQAFLEFSPFFRNGVCRENHFWKTLCFPVLLQQEMVSIMHISGLWQIMVRNIFQLRQR
jgi:hypothetical protein